MSLSQIHQAVHPAPRTALSLTRILITVTCSILPLFPISQVPRTVRPEAMSIESPPDCPSSPGIHQLQATQLTPHRPWDCAIKLKEDEPVPRGKIYSLSLPEQKAMEQYITEAIHRSYKRSSRSPASLSCFFVPKKDGGI